MKLVIVLSVIIIVYHRKEKVCNVYLCIVNDVSHLKIMFSFLYRNQIIMLYLHPLQQGALCFNDLIKDIYCKLKIHTKSSRIAQ